MQKSANSFLDIRVIPSFEANPKIVSFVQTGPGKAVVVILFSLGLFFFEHNPYLILGYALAYGLITFKPEYRRLVIAISPSSGLYIPTCISHA